MGPVWQSVVKEQEPLFASILLAIRTARPILQHLAEKNATLKRGTLKRLGHDQHDLIMLRREWDMHSTTFPYTLRSMISRTASPRPKHEHVDKRELWGPDTCHAGSILVKLSAN